ncbi:MAG TPA: hypothetical protein VFE24_02860 [Pirellulales bacterium]|nr:hypothetical protein [Pirellulales bacterium]
MLIHAKPYGRLGNQLFLFANLLACAIENDLTLLCPMFGANADYFASWRENWLCRYPLPPRRPVSRRRRELARRGLYRLGRIVSRFAPAGRWTGAIELAESESFELAAPDFVWRARYQRMFLTGWMFRAEAEMIKHAAAIRELFHPCEPFQSEAAERVRRARLEADVLVGMHLRRGDYRLFAGGKYFYTWEQYRAVFDRVADLFPGRRVAFLACSDEPIPEGAFPPHRVLHEPAPFMSDLAALAGCDYLVGPPSSFSAWASYYGDKPLLQLNSATHEITLEGFHVATQW